MIKISFSFAIKIKCFSRRCLGSLIPGRSIPICTGSATKLYSKGESSTQDHQERNHNQRAQKSEDYKAVLMTSLSSGYYEKVRDIYWEQATMTGEVIGVYQPSNEGYQQNEKKMHNKKAWAEMYLLSLTDKLVASSWTTFGYVAQGLGGLKPWILYKPESRMAPDPPCH
ncbi:hypothetical protein LguiB_007921 [Lonicera macranthoides]